MHWSTYRYITTTKGVLDQRSLKEIHVHCVFFIFIWMQLSFMHFKIIFTSASVDYDKRYPTKKLMYINLCNAVYLDETWPFQSNHLTSLATQVYISPPLALTILLMSFKFVIPVAARKIVWNSHSSLILTSFLNIWFFKKP